VSDPEIIVTKIIALAKAGEHNADRLVESSTIWQKRRRGLTLLRSGRHLLAPLALEHL
jgi:hypothetical protein